MKTKLVPHIAVVISSSDSTFDVFVALSDNFASHLSDLDIPIYVATTSQIPPKPFLPLPAQSQSSWQQELEHSLKRLPESCSHVVLILDDFWFLTPLVKDDLVDSLEVMCSEGADYFRLSPPVRSGVSRLLRYFAGLPIFKRSNERFIHLSEDEPYFSSLQPAIWKKEHLINSLRNASSIWHFEHLVLSGSKHITAKRHLARWRHLVRKGRWCKYANSIASIDIGSLSYNRAIDARQNIPYLRASQLKTLIFGYSWLKLRYWLSGT